MKMAMMVPPSAHRAGCFEDFFKRRLAGTFDPFLRAFDVESGRELWKNELPFSGHATPMTYKLAPTGKQFVVIAAGGHPKIAEEHAGDTLVAFALP
jgi:quinoprotein glucose dehydrogenase